MEGIKLDTLERVEHAMSQIERMLATDQNSVGVGPKVIAPLAEAILTLARELRQLRDRRT